MVSSDYQKLGQHVWNIGFDTWNDHDHDHYNYHHHHIIHFSRQEMVNAWKSYIQLWLKMDLPLELPTSWYVLLKPRGLWDIWPITLYVFVLLRSLKGVTVGYYLLISMLYKLKKDDIKTNWSKTALKVKL